MASKPHPDMSDYEASEWNSILEKLRKKERRRERGPVRWVRERSAAIQERAGTFVEDHELLQRVADGLGDSLTGLQDYWTRAASSTVLKNQIIRRAAKRDPEISQLASIRAADLRIADEVSHHLPMAYATALGAEGAGTALAITGAEVSATVSGGTTLAIAAGAIIVDITTLVGAMSRGVAEVATSYGYDLAEPNERLWAMGVLGYGASASPASRLVALGELSRLTQTMMRHPTHAVLDKFALVKAIKAFFKVLGFKIGHRKLAQIVPFAGVVYSAGSNVATMLRLMDRAREAYRLRFLTEKYDLDAASWLAGLEVPDEAPTDAISIEEIIEEAGADDSPDQPTMKTPNEGES